jgi:pimeloyl-ACP methyl ester carboxylesterase
MATPTLTKHNIPGALGEILVDVRAGGREAPRPAVVIIPGFKGFKDWGMFPPLADRLARAGFTAVAINLSGSGVDDSGDFVWPDRFGHNTFSAELEDIATAVEALATGKLETAPPTRIGLIGHSRGGGMALLHTARDPRVKALVTWAAISTVDRWPDDDERVRWRRVGSLDVVNSRTGQVLPLYTDVLDDIESRAAELDILEAAQRATAPWLIIHGSADSSVSIAEGERLARAAPATSRFVRVDGAAHTFGAAHPWQGSTAALDLVVKETVGWLSRHLL